MRTPACTQEHVSVFPLADSDTVFPETLSVTASLAVLLSAAQETTQRIQQLLFQQDLNDKHK